MFGAYIRAGVTVCFAVVIAAILKFIIPYFLRFQGGEGTLLYRSFESIGANALFIILFGVAASLVARAVAESEVS